MAAVRQGNTQRSLPGAVTPSKDEFRRYWRAVGRQALKYLARRPVVLVRHAEDRTFFHQAKAVHQLRMEKREGGEGTRVWVDPVEGLLGLVDMDVVEVHPWGATVDDIEHPDLLVIDLDPADGVDWSFVTEAALALRDEAAVAGLCELAQTSGGKGLHVGADRAPMALVRGPGVGRETCGGVREARPAMHNSI